MLGMRAAHVIGHARAFSGVQWPRNTVVAPRLLGHTDAREAVQVHALKQGARGQCTPQDWCARIEPNQHPSSPREDVLKNQGKAGCPPLARSLTELDRGAPCETHTRGTVWAAHDHTAELASARSNACPGLPAVLAPMPYWSSSGRQVCSVPLLRPIVRVSCVLLSGAQLCPAAAPTVAPAAARSLVLMQVPPGSGRLFDRC